MKKLNCVLLVDDNESDNYLHKMVLEQSGFVDHIETAMDGEEAEDVLKSKVVVVMLTTSINSGDRRRAEKGNESIGFLNKPLTLEMINEIIKKEFPDYL